MTAEQIRKFYLSKQKEAEETAARMRDPLIKQQWLSIAEGYRFLARPREFRGGSPSS